MLGEGVNCGEFIARKKSGEKQEHRKGGGIQPKS
jgi:hypothetical protein